jgi:hypothetical protein
MGPLEIKRIVDERPFRPVRIHLTDGKSYDIRHPEMVLVAKRELIVGLPSSPSATVPDRVASVNILHVVRIEPIEEGGKKSPRKRSA